MRGGGGAGAMPGRLPWLFGGLTFTQLPTEIETEQRESLSGDLEMQGRRDKETSGQETFGTTNLLVFTIRFNLNF